jgi:hypothetical protein
MFLQADLTVKTTELLRWFVRFVKLLAYTIPDAINPGLTEREAEVNSSELDALTRLWS